VESINYARTADRAERLVLIVLLGFLAYRLVPSFEQSPFNFVYLISETIVVALIAFRRSAAAISLRLDDWAVGFGGTLLPLLVDRGEGSASPLGAWMMLAGFGVALGSQISLWRSFGVVAANRGVRSAGLYRFVRHPMYMGYFVTQLGFLLANPAVWNAVVYIVWAACQLRRIEAEERVLSADFAYVALMQRVRYRLLPFVY
jgi:protein-S-isoprenylcysteine O-methyltransferase Ste14